MRCGEREWMCHVDVPRTVAFREELRGRDVRVLHRANAQQVPDGGESAQNAWHSRCCCNCAKDASRKSAQNHMQTCARPLRVRPAA